MTSRTSIRRSPGEEFRLPLAQPGRQPRESRMGTVRAQHRPQYVCSPVLKKHERTTATYFELPSPQSKDLNFYSPRRRRAAT